MNIAEAKKTNNISEYIIHMYRTEDLIRAFNFDINEIKEYVIKHFPTGEGEKEAVIKWYEKTIKRMKEEGIEDTGHLLEIQKYRDELSALKDTLIIDDHDFKEVYAKAEAHIKNNMELSGGLITNEVQICLNGVYGFLLMRLNGKTVGDDIMESINAFGNVLSYLSFKHKQAGFINRN